MPRVLQAALLVEPLLLSREFAKTRDNHVCERLVGFKQHGQQQQTQLQNGTSRCGRRAAQGQLKAAGGPRALLPRGPGEAVGHTPCITSPGASTVLLILSIKFHSLKKRPRVPKRHGLSTALRIFQCLLPMEEGRLSDILLRRHIQ